MFPALSEGSMEQIMKGVNVDKPVVQILGQKKVGAGSERYRLLLSDGISVNSYTMLATQLNHLIRNNELPEFSICEIEKYAISSVNSHGKKKIVMVILAIKRLVSGNEVGEKIGNPVILDSSPEEDATSSTDNSMAQNDTSNQSTTKKTVQNSSPDHNSKAKRVKLDMSETSATPIAALSPYSNRYVIKALVVNKSDVRQWSNSRGEGKLFSFEVLDESGQIKITAFRDQCDKFFDTVEQGKVYYISNCTVKPANKQYSQQEYELYMTNDTQVLPCDEDFEIPPVRFRFVSIIEIEKKQVNETIDVLGIVKSVGEVQKIIKRTTGTELRKREINIVDESNTMVTLTLWGNQAEEFNASNNSVLAVKGARVGEFNGGKTLSCMSTSIIQVDPDIPEAHKLRGWFNTYGQSEEMQSLSKVPGVAGINTDQWITFDESKRKKLGHSQNPDFYVVQAAIGNMKVLNCMYQACPTEGCKKKVIDLGNDMYKCEKCNKEYPNFKYLLILKVNLIDCTDNEWVTMFNDQAEKMLNHSAQELGEMSKRDNNEYVNVFAKASFKSFVFKLKSSLEHYNDEGRIRTTCISITPVDYKIRNAYLLDKVRNMIDMKKL